MDEIKTKQQVIEKIKESTKILVTVSDNPSVDALSAALALTLLLDKQEKYSTAIFSGETPPAIAFLEPEKTFDDTTDSLRDFIIALNKEKADHLRYKVEGESVKIFITPYKTTIDQNDLEFSQGDYNVELVIALGVDKQENLDGALENHGQILHDAAIITMTAGDQTSDLGGIDWHDANSSSLSEMVMGLAEAMKTDKKKSLVDAPIATALLTGIVAETDRFSNEHTTSKAMTVAATLMSAGADQQLIANELQAANEIATAPKDSNDSGDDSDTDSDVDIDTDSQDGTMTIKKDHDATALDITHSDETLADLDRRVRGEEKAKERVIEEVEAAEVKAAQEEASQESQQAAQIQPPVQNDTFETLNAQPAVGTAYEADDDTAEPTLGGTLNATTDQAADDARREIENDQNKTILSHSYIGGAPEPTAENASPESSAPEGFPGTPSVAPGSMGVNDVPESEEVHSAYAPENGAPHTQETPQPSVAIGGERVIQPLSAPAPVEPTQPASAPAIQAPVFIEPAPAPGPVDLGLPLPPPIPDFSQVNGGPAIPLPPTPPPAILGDILAPEPFAQDASNAIPAPDTAYAPEPIAPVFPQPSTEIPQPPQSATADPTQFQIPTQQ